MTHEDSIEIHAPASRIFAIYRDVARWNTWDPDTRSSHLDGPFCVGTRGQLVPTKGRAVPMALTEVTADRSFTVECQVPLFRMRFIHTLVPVADGTKVTQRLETSGWLGFALNPVIGRQVRTGFPKTLASLKRLAESTASHPATPGAA